MGHDLFDVTIRAEDVNGVRIAASKIEVHDNLGATASSDTGELVWKSAGGLLNVRASHPRYAPEALTVVLAEPAWDLPTARVTLSANQVQVFVVLTRVVEASRFRIDKKLLDAEKPPENSSDAEKAAVAKRNAHSLKGLNDQVTGILSNTGSDGKESYLWVANERVEFTSTDTKPGPVLTSSARQGWERFRTKTTQIDVNAQGQFLLVQYGGSPASGWGSTSDAKDLPLLVSLYIPNLDAGPVLTERDVLVFLPPNTAKPEYSVQYPLGLLQSGNQFEQPFVARLGVGYMFANHYLIHQLLATKRKCVLVMPVWRQNDPGVLMDPRAMLRLMREVVAFAHKRQVTGMRNAKRNEVGPQYPIPKVGQVAIAAFSAGAVFLSECLRESPGQDLSPLQSIPSTDPARFAQYWRETFDLDASASEVFDVALAKWKLRDERRGIRIASSGYTGRMAGDLAKRGGGDSPLLGQFVTGPITSAAGPPGPMAAVETYATNGGFSALITTGPYLRPQFNDTVPFFSWSGDNHKFTPTFGLAWAITNSRLR
jgi:hypothetical protein